MPCKFTAIILAAGFSKRMGKFKPLLPLGDKPIIAHIVNQFREAGISDIRVVVGYNKEKLQPVLARLRVKTLYNPNFREGMFSSVVTGVSSLEPEVEAAFILPVDIPLVDSDTISHLMKVYHQTEDDILRPCFNGKRGHPPLIPKSCFDNILNWVGEGGLKAVLGQMESRAVMVEVSSKDILFDVDTPDDYAQLQDRWQHYSGNKPDSIEIPKEMTHEGNGNF